jgi:crossover junction endodeoxyribonuclease RuvC
MVRAVASPSIRAPVLRVLGIDPGTRRLGWGVVERKGPRLFAVAAGVLVLDPTTALEARLLEIDRALCALIERHGPQAIALEDVFYAKFPRAAIQLAHVRGVVLLGAAQAELPIQSYAPALVKRTVAGRGAADKRQVAGIIAATLGLKKAPPSDAADALAIAITHLATLRGV